MPPPFAGNIQNQNLISFSLVSDCVQVAFRYASSTGRIQTMADKGKADKGRKEAQKKPAMTLKEKRKVKNDKKNSK